MKLKPLFTPDIIQSRVTDLGARISRDFKDRPVVAVCVLKGAVVFYADLIRSLSIEPEMDFVRISSYGDQTISNGNVVFSKDLEISVKDKHVLIVEDIIDTGRSIVCLKKVLQDKNPESIHLCALIDKRERREVPVKVDYAGFVLQHGFIVGYGLDYAEKHRNLTGIFELILEK
ncbi:MAG: hypoxanthine phosphoribosyltransferase [Desulfonatronovibrio sp.]